MPPEPQSCSFPSVVGSVSAKMVMNGHRQATARRALPSAPYPSGKASWHRPTWRWRLLSVGLDDDSGISIFLERWGLPIIKDEIKPASMAVAEIHELVRNVRDAVVYASRHDDTNFKIQFDRHAFFAARPQSDPKGESAVLVECRDPAAMAWLELAQRERINVTYRSCDWCNAFFAVYRLRRSSTLATALFGSLPCGQTGPNRKTEIIASSCHACPIRLLGAGIFFPHAGREETSPAEAS